MWIEDFNLHLSRRPDQVACLGTERETVDLRVVQSQIADKLACCCFTDCQPPVELPDGDQPAIVRKRYFMNVFLWSFANGNQFPCLRVEQASRAMCSTDRE